MNCIKEWSGDDLLLGYIQRINLVAMWSRTSSTINVKRSLIWFVLQLLEQVGLAGTYEHFGALLFKDHCGIK